MDDLLAFDCLRCGTPTEARFVGLCVGCRDAVNEYRPGGARPIPVPPVVADREPAIAGPFLRDVDGNLHPITTASVAKAKRARRADPPFPDGTFANWDGRLFAEVGPKGMIKVLKDRLVDPDEVEVRRAG